MTVPFDAQSWRAPSRVNKCLSQPQLREHSCTRRREEHRWMPSLNLIHTDLSVSAAGPRDAQVPLTGAHSPHTPQTALQHHLCRHVPASAKAATPAQAWLPRAHVSMFHRGELQTSGEPMTVKKDFIELAHHVSPPPPAAC